MTIVFDFKNYNKLVVDGFQHDLKTLREDYVDSTRAYDEEMLKLIDELGTEVEEAISDLEEEETED